MKKIIRNVIRQCGFDLVKYPPATAAEPVDLRDLSAEEKRIIAAVQPYTLTSIERRAGLIHAVTHVIKNGLQGDIAECGVWRGGSMMTIAMTLLAHGDRSRHLYLYDTFEGMSEPTVDDRHLDGTSADELLETSPRGAVIWCEASLEDVRENVLSTGYPEDKIHFIKGKVEETIPQHLPGNLALLRLDTDWYESTKHELNHLYPLLRENGILIIDDYGHWQGARKAVDEYFSTQSRPVYLHRIDYTGRALVKVGA